MGTLIMFALEKDGFRVSQCADASSRASMQVKDTVAVHVPCSSKKMGIEAAFMNLARRCAKDVKPTAVPCCGMAGDRGMRYAPLPTACPHSHGHHRHSTNPHLIAAGEPCL